MRRIHVVAFKMAPKYQKNRSRCLHGDGSAKRNRSGCLHGDGSVWDRNGSKNWTCFLGGPVFGPDRERIDGTVSRSRVNKRPIRHDFWIGTIWNRSRVNIALLTLVQSWPPCFLSRNSLRAVNCVTESGGARTGLYSTWERGWTILSSVVF